ncbi:MAG TPA: transcriptional regulator, partial [Bacteroidales bacterium]|nr:transcriptional regulator [Bacteroidales bacterium]
MTQSQTLAEIIKMHRKAARLSRAQLAEMAGVGKTVIYDIEKGKESIRLNTLQKVLKVLNIKIELTSP